MHGIDAREALPASADAAPLDDGRRDGVRQEAQHADEPFCVEGGAPEGDDHAAISRLAEQLRRRTFLAEEQRRLHLAFQGPEHIHQRQGSAADDKVFIADIEDAQLFHIIRYYGKAHPGGRKGLSAARLPGPFPAGSIHRNGFCPAARCRGSYIFCPAAGR